METLKYGQWIGTSESSKGVSVRIMLNMEKRSSGFALVCSYSPVFPTIRTVVSIEFPEFKNEVEISLEKAYFFVEDSGELIPARDFWARHNIKDPLPTRTRYYFDQQGKVISGRFEVDTQDKGTFKLTNTIDEPAKPADHQLSWHSFKDFVGKHYTNSPSIIFRGQPDNRYKLRTLFHRCGRNNLLEYSHEDYPRLRHMINAVSSFFYRHDDPESMGALLSLAQHHGYPTPLLDWSFSPYIAAFFAFLESVAKQAEAVRIFAFDMRGWPRPPIKKMIYDPLASITFHEFSAHNNPRFIPQQSIASFSNVDDMETYVRQEEWNTGRKHLTVIDIPISDRQAALDDLRLMGITHGSLFPGLDGTCRTLRDRYF